MFLQLRKYFASFLLFLLLFPTGIELVHNYIHKDEIHCTQTGLHYHQTEHHCAIDDFVPFISDIPPFQQFIPYFKNEYLGATSFYKTPFVSQTYKCHFSLRGPPSA